MRSIFLAALLLCPVAFAQSPAPRAQPDYGVQTAGLLLAVARMPDGRLIVGGSFEQVNGVPRSNLARIGLDGRVDDTWNPDPDGSVTGLAVDAQGNIFVAGSFAGIGGLARNSIAKLSPLDGDADAAWAPVASGVTGVVMGSNDALYLVGDFGTVNGQPRKRVAKLSTLGSGTLDAAWTPDPEPTVNHLWFDATSQRVYLAGNFATVSGAARPHLARVHADTAVADAWNPAPDSPVFQVVPDGAGNVYVTGNFDTIGGAERPYVARLSASTGMADGFLAFPNGSPATRLRIDATHVYLGGAFTGINGIARPRLARLSRATGEIDLQFAPRLSEVPYELFVPGDGRVYAGYQQRIVNDAASPGAAVLDPASGALLEPLYLTRPGEVRALAALDDGSVIVGGDFLTVDGLPRRYAFKLRDDGRVDPDWDPPLSIPVSTLAAHPGTGTVHVKARVDAGLSRVVRLLPDSGALDPVWNSTLPAVINSLAVDGAGAVYAATGTGPGSQPRGVVKLSADGSVDATWANQADSSATTVVAGPDGWIYVSGNFTSIGGIARHRLARLDAQTGLGDAGWAAQLAGTDLVHDFAFADGSVYAGGSFLAIGGSNPFLAKLDAASGDAAPGWGPSVNGSIYGVAVDAAGGLIVAGSASGYEGLQRTVARVVRSSGALDVAWDPQPFVPFGTTMQAVDVDRFGDAVLGGGFTAVGGQTRYGLAVVPLAAEPAGRIFRGSFEAR